MSNVQTLAESFLADLDELSDDDEHEEEEEEAAHDDDDEQVRSTAPPGVHAPWLIAACAMRHHSDG